MQYDDHVKLIIWHIEVIHQAICDSCRFLDVVFTVINTVVHENRTLHNR